MPRVTRSALLLALPLCLAASSPALAEGCGMPQEARSAIHTLLDSHDSIERTVTLTETGYVAVTESDDPQIVAALQAHVRQMGERLESGLAVRRWDPAFAEYVSHYDEMQHRFEATERGVRMEVTASSPAAIAVARNHASVIVDFVDHGWDAHDRTHAAVGGATTDDDGTGRGCGRGRGRRAAAETGRGCCGGCGAGS